MSEAKNSGSIVNTYLTEIKDDSGPGIVKPLFEENIKFEFWGQCIKELKENMFYEKDNEDTHEHISNITDIIDLFHLLGGSQGPGLDAETRRKVNFKGPIPRMTPTKGIEAIKELSEHSFSWYKEGNIKAENEELQGESNDSGFSSKQEDWEHNDFIKPTLFVASTLEAEAQLPKLKELPSHLEHTFLNDNQEFLEFMEVFMDDFSIFGNSFDSFLANLSKMLARCEETNLVLNKEKCHFMVKEGIVLGHKISIYGIEVDIEKINVIAKLPYPTNIKKEQFLVNNSIRSFAQSTTPNPLLRLRMKKGTKNLAADHLSRLENPELEKINEEAIRDSFLDEHLMAIHVMEAEYDPWTAYKSPIKSTPFRIVYGTSCHLPIKMKHKAYWALKNVNLDLDTARKHRLKLFPGKLKTRWYGPYMVNKVFPNETVQFLHQGYGIRGDTSLLRVHDVSLCVGVGSLVSRVSNTKSGELNS
nr:putative SWI/SNF-related matrix-associated actin-dependent regulator of chromatin subfamily A member 3-like 1 [Tanacetum cinerariifolium]GEW87309.1 putative SWI/SNF-related matrix-associated actin-dependent regulator of chromatin subfamily A member 3-like 1 [Tanacetum cinerariifolium]